MNTAAVVRQVSHALAEAKELYRESNTESYAQHVAASRALPGGNTRTVIFVDPFPITLTEGKDAQVKSLDGRWYRDFLGEYTAGFYGHSNPHLRAAAMAALDRGWSMGGHTEAEAEMAFLLQERFPSMELLRFANSGTEANLYAISTAMAYTGKKKIVVFEGAYHGGVFVFSGASRHPLTAPFDFIVAPYNDIEGTTALLAQHANEIAAVIVEPMQGSGGCIPASLEFLQHLREWTALHGTVLIFDEVMTSRLSYGGMQAVHTITPDMTTLGKYLGGGFSFGAFGGRSEIMNVFNPLRPNAIGHAGTFNNNIFTMTAGAAGLKHVLTKSLIEEVNGRGEKLRRQLNELVSGSSLPMTFTGRGSMMNVHMTRANVRSVRDLKDNIVPLRDLFYYDMVREGFWIAKRGMINVSIPTTDADCEALLQAVSHFVESRADLVLS
ncbi:aspartate aminotransferase family protein [Cupriavidus numazuensis]|uniref:Beta-phenylalanine transaminase n=1 Tax=Cupriavidus numazuensis TaxID=221992 RepID=A0ABM8TL81_9BURK|nr:aminotransferase class III-fold pyridoxal phosphate-dependent enzyme [Cupriavidus numazuensis]CAG2153137.1 Beta-phenylalanine transaminase [Cupriavidus numazuensis]